MTSVDHSNEADEMAGEATRAAMKSGAHAIVQASLGTTLSHSMGLMHLSYREKPLQPPPNLQLQSKK